MKRFVLNPNLPSGQVKTVIAGEMSEKINDSLTKIGIDVLPVKNDERINNSTSCHADIHCIHLGSNRILLSSYQTCLTDLLKNRGFEVELFNFKGYSYPYDCTVNAAILGKNAVCNYEISDELLKKHLINNNYRIIDVKQGYSKCSVCIVDEESVITEDEGIKNACEKNGIDVLLIHKGFVRLSGFDYGFIGGASFKLNKQTLAFTGDIFRHPDSGSIITFLNKKGIKAVSLSDDELTDIGSLLPIEEK